MKFGNLTYTLYGELIEHAKEHVWWNDERVENDVEFILGSIPWHPIEVPDGTRLIILPMDSEFEPILGHTPAFPLRRIGTHKARESVILPSSTLQYKRLIKVNTPQAWQEKKLNGKIVKHILCWQPDLIFQP